MTDLKLLNLVNATDCERKFNSTECLYVTFHEPKNETHLQLEPLPHGTLLTWNQFFQKYKATFYSKR